MWLAMGIWVRILTGSNSAAGLVFFAFGVPQLFGPLSGVVVDRFKRRPLLIAVNLAIGTAVLALLFVHGRSDVWIIYAVMVLYGASSNLIGPAQSALLSTMLPDEVLPYGNSFLSMSQEGMRLVSPLAGAGLFVALGGGWVAVLDAATFYVAAGCLFLIQVDEPAPVRSDRHWAREALAGAAHVLRTAALRQLTVATCLAVLCFGFGETIIFAVVTRGLHRSPSFLGVILSVQGITGVAGALLSAPLMKRTSEGLLCGIGMLIVAAGAPMQMSSNLAVVLGGVLLFGLGIPFVVVGLTTAFQRKTPSSLQGRAFASLDILIGLPQTASIGAGAALVAVVDYRVLLLLMGVVAASAGVWVVSRPEQRRLALASVPVAESGV